MSEDHDQDAEVDPGFEPTAGGGAGDAEPEIDFSDADQAEAEEAEAAAAEDLYEEEIGSFGGPPAPAEIQQAMDGARAQDLQSKASWSLVHKELLLLLFANCLMFAGVLAAWSRAAPGEAGDPSRYVHGLDTIRGALIFTLAIYGFCVTLINIRFRQLILWPFLINALFALWVGIPGFTRTIGSDSWTQAQHYLDSLPSKSLIDKMFIPLSSIPPAYWMLTAGGALVLIVLLKGLLSGMSSVRAAAAEAAERGGRRSRRR